MGAPVVAAGRTRRVKTQTKAAAPQLVEAFGVGLDIAAEMLVTAGDNSNRMRWHEPTIAYVARRSAEGLSKRAIIRCLKRYRAREIYHLLPPMDGMAAPGVIPRELVA